MELFYTGAFVLPLPAGHRFPMDKYAQLRQWVENSELSKSCSLLLPAAATREAVIRAHSEDYFERVCAGALSAREQREIGFPWSPAMVERSLRSAGATIAACRSALRNGVSANMAGGTHHAHADRGAGFCVFNDSAIAARAMQAEGSVSRVLVVDCDVHQGDGTARILEADSSIFTLSLHGEKNYPFRKARSDLDVPLPDGIGDSGYLAALRDALDQCQAAGPWDLVIYLAGADPYKGDRFGRLGLSIDGLQQRDETVFAFCADHQLPVAITMAGGYAKAIEDTVAIHFNTLCAAQALHAARHQSRRTS